MFAAAYPLLAIATVFTLRRLSQRLLHRFPAIPPRLYRLAGAAIVAVVLPASVIDHALDALAGSRTGYCEIDRAFAQAADEGLKVRFYGNFLAATFFGQRHGVTVNTNEDSLDVVTGDTQAALIFEDSLMPVLSQLEADPRISPSDYTVTTISHRTAYRPAMAENYGIGPEALRELSRLSYAHSPAPQTTSLVIWWPQNPRGTFEARTVRQRYIFTYEGGCSLPRPIYAADGTQVNYYTLLADKGQVVWQELRQGDLSEIFRLVRKWVTE
jgi:hypothetical protein